MMLKAKVKSKNLVYLFLILFVTTPALAGQDAEEADFALAKKAFNGGYYEIAEDRLESLLKTYPGTGRLYEIHSLLGRCHFAQNNLADALNEFDIVLDAPGGSASLDEALYWTGEIYLKKGDYRKALEFHQKVMDDFPSSSYLANSLYSKGWAYYKLGCLDEAAKSFGEVSRRFPYERIACEAQFRSAECEYLAGRWDKAADELEAFIEKFPVSEKTAETYYLMGETSFYLAKYRDAVGYFEKAMSILPDSKWAGLAVYRLAQALFYNGDYGRSSKEFTRLFEHGSMALKAASLLGLAQNYEKTGKIGEAQELYDRVIRAYPESAAAQEAYCRKAKIFSGLGNYAKAGATAKEGIEKFPESKFLDELRYELALAYKMEGMDNEALNEFSWVAAESQSAELSCGSNAGMGDIYFGKKDYKRAIEFYDTVLDKYPESPVAPYAQYRIGCIFFVSGRYDEATLAYRALLSNFPSSVLSGEAKFYLASSLYNTGNLDTALTIFTEAEKELRDPSTRAMARYQIAWCYYKMGNDQAAIEEFNKFLKDYPGQELAEDASYQLAVLVYEAGKTGEALARLADVTSRYPGTDSANLAYRKIAKIKKDNKDYAGAIENLKRSLGKDNDELNAQTQYEIAECFEAKGDLVRAAEEYLKVPELYPEGDFWAVRAELRCAKIFEALDKLTAAKPLYEKLAAMGVEESEFAKSRLEWIRMRTAK